MASGGEQAPFGAKSVEVFSNMVSVFGWILRRRQDRNFPCQVCKPPKKGGYKNHGVDLFFTFECPYLQAQRGVYVDGKRYAFSSVTSVAQIKKWLTDAREVVSHLDRSQILFRDALDLPNSLRIDTGIVAWECHEGWNADKALELRKKINLSITDDVPIHLHFFQKDHLDRVNSMREFAKQWPHIKFLYIVNEMVHWRKELTPELIVSNWWPFKYRKSAENEWINAIVCFDVTQTNEIRFLLPVLAYLQCTGYSSLEVHLPMGDSQLSEMQEVLSATLKVRGVDLQLKCVKFSKVEFQS